MIDYNPCQGCDFFNKPYWSIVSPCANCHKRVTSGFVTTTITNVPSVEYAPVRHGRWVQDGDFLICDNCESEINIKNSLGEENAKNFCPCCGAKMDEEE